MQKYVEDSIKTLTPREHIRLRTGMYIGRLGDGSNPSDGIYILLKEVIDNSVDEFIMNFGKKIEISLKNTKVSVRDFGRGIPLGKLVECASEMNTGGKYNDDVFQYSVGLNGVGIKAVNALSERFKITSYREGEFKSAIFEKGVLINEGTGKTSEKNGTYIEFIPDEEIFPAFSWNIDFIKNRLRYYSFLNNGLSLNLFYNGIEERYISKNGLTDLLSLEIGGLNYLYNFCSCKSNKVEFSFTHTNSYGEKYYSFVNGQYTNDGGTHQSAFREAVLKAVNEFSGKSFAGEDVRDGIIGAVAVKIQDPVFESQTKNKLGSSDVRSWIFSTVKEEIVLWLHKNPQEAEKLINKVKNNERLRKELSSVKKEAKERAKKISIRIPKLVDCKVHYNEDHKDRDKTSIFITEGDSAAGAMIQSRDVYTQAIFALKGKPLNVYGSGRDIIYKNEELYNIMQALNIENGLDGLKYNKVVIATDADVDGMHIRNLLITFFLKFFEDLVIKGHLYVFETPLFRIRNKSNNIYCYSEKELEEAKKKLKSHEITRFKGLGEISPKEFNNFLKKDDPKITQITINSYSEISKSLELFMGKNSKERKEFILNNLDVYNT
jgi:topoisomerase IV subunit B